MGSIHESYKDTLNLPKTDFPMKAGLTAREPELLAKWESEKLYERIQEARKDAAQDLLPARRPAICQRRRAHGHRSQQDPEGFRGQVAHHGGLSRAVRPWLGLPRTADRVQGGQRITRAVAGGSSQAIGGLRAQVYRDPEAAVPAARRARRLGQSLPDAFAGATRRKSSARSRNSWRRGSCINRRSRSIGAPGAQTALAEAEVEYADREDPGDSRANSRS